VTAPAPPVFDRALVEIARRARVLPALHPRNAATERARLTDELARGRVPVPAWDALDRPDVRGLGAAIDRVRSELPAALPPELSTLYATRLDELELDVAILDALGDTRRLRALSARRFGTGGDRVGTRLLRDLAREILERDHAHEDDPPVVPAEKLATMMSDTAHAVGLAISVRIEPRLSAGAATGDRTVFVQAREFGAIEARRLVAHEILGHAIAASRASTEKLAIFTVGTAGAFADQEGLAIALEDAAGALDAARLRILAARVVATDRVHDGAPFGETARLLVDGFALSARAAISVTERAYRGGGVARDAGYLAGWHRVRDALASGQAELEELRAGRVGLPALPALRWARANGWASALAPALDTTRALAALRAAETPGETLIPTGR